MDANRSLNSGISEKEYRSELKNLKTSLAGDALTRPGILRVVDQDGAPKIIRVKGPARSSAETDAQVVRLRNFIEEGQKLGVVTPDEIMDLELVVARVEGGQKFVDMLNKFLPPRSS
jgi:hypothetical protein